MYIRDGVDVEAFIGEPGLIPGQADDIKAVRKLIVGGTLPGQRGLDAVAVKIPGVWRIVTGSGSESLQPDIAVGEAKISAFAYATEDDEAGPTYGYQYIHRRVNGARKVEGTAPTPNPLDCQTVLVAERIEEGDEVTWWPIWCGFATDCRRMDSPDGADSYVVMAEEYSGWLASGVLDPRWLTEGSREFAAESPAVRIREIMRRIGFLENRPGGGSGWNPWAATSAGAWDEFCPRRTRQGISPGSDSALGVNDATGEPVVLPKLTVAPGSSLGVQDQIAKMALISEGRIIQHHGVGPIRADRQKPDKETVPAGFGYPSAQAQIDWGGVTAGLRNTVNDQGLYEFGGFETPITLTPFPEPDTEWQAHYKTTRSETSGKATANVAVRSGISADGSPRPPVTFIMSSGGAEESKKWIRRFGIRESVAMGLPVVERDPLTDSNADIINAAQFAAAATRAARFLQTFAAPRPMWNIEQVNAVKSINEAKVAGALQVGHTFKLRTDAGFFKMLVMQVTNDFSPGSWTKELACTPADTVFDTKTGLMLPAPPRPRNWGGVATPGQYVGKVDPYAPVTGPTGDNPPRAPDSHFRFPWTDFDDLDPGPPPDPLESGYDRFGPRCVVTPDGRAIVWWSWPEDIGELPILGWRLEAKVIESPGRDKAPHSRLYWGHDPAPIKTLPAVAQIDPWKMYHVFDPDPELMKPGRVVMGEVHAVTAAHPLTSYGPYAGTSRFYSVPPDPPGVVRDLFAVHRPESSVVNVGWRTPETTGGDEIAYYGIYTGDDLDTPAATHLGKLPAGTTCATNAFTATAATEVKVAAFNVSGALPVDDLASVTLNEPETVRGTAAVPDFSDAEVHIVRQAAPSAQLRILYFWGAPELPSTGQVDGAEIEITEGGSKRTVTLTRAQYLLGVYTSSFAGTGALAFRIRGKTGTAFGPWSETTTLRAAEPPGAPRPVISAAVPLTTLLDGAAPAVGLFRTGDGTRETSDGWGAVFAAPDDPGDMPADRSDIATVTQQGAAVPKVADGHNYTPGGNKGYYDLLPTAAGKLGYGKRAFVNTGSSPGLIAFNAKARARGVVGDSILKAIPAVGPPGAPEDLIMWRESPESDYAKLAFHMPRVRSAGQPAQFEYRLIAPSISDWTTVDINPASGTRPTIPRFQVGTGAATVEVRCRTANGQWGPKAQASIPSVADGRGPREAGRSIFGAVRDIDVLYVPWLPGTTDVLPTTGNVPQVVPVADAADDFLMLIVWQEPPRSSSGMQPNSYLVSVTGGFNDWPGRSNRTNVRSTGMSAADLTRFQNSNEGLWCSIETGSRNLSLAVPMKGPVPAFHAHPELDEDNPSSYGPWIRVSIYAQQGVGLRTDGTPSRTGQAGRVQRVQYFRTPRRPRLNR